MPEVDIDNPWCYALRNKHYDPFLAKLLLIMMLFALAWLAGQIIPHVVK